MPLFTAPSATILSGSSAKPKTIQKRSSRKFAGLVPVSRLVWSDHRKIKPYSPEVGFWEVCR
jgi:hypothetical protein